MATTCNSCFWLVDFYNILYDVTSVINEPTKFCGIKTQLFILCVMNDPVVVLSQVCFCVDQKSRMPITAVWCWCELLLRWPITSWSCRFKKSLKIPKGVIRIPKWKKDKQCNYQKKYDKTDKQWSTKLYTKKYRLSNTNPTKNWRSTQVLPNDKTVRQTLVHRKIQIEQHKPY